MNFGEETIQWLYNDQLQVDDGWSIRTANGFTWWADKHAQTIEVLGEETGPDGDSAYLVSVRTDFLRNFEINQEAVAKINALLMSFASMAGPVYDLDTRTLRLCSLVRVHREISSWMNLLISVAAALQIAEARIMAPAVAETVKAQEALSGHPQNGMRHSPDDLAEAVATLIAPAGQEPCRWPQREFQDAVNQHMRQPPVLEATTENLGFRAEILCGAHSSIFQVSGDEPHPRYGNGLFSLQSFPLGGRSDAAGESVALSLNAMELGRKPWGYGFGSYAYRNGAIYFTNFFPNATYKTGLLPNLYYAAALRAREIAGSFMQREKEAPKVPPRRGGIGRRVVDLLKGR
jgi:hypothetical protein